MSLIDLSTSRISVILNSSDDWLIWINNIKIIAQNKGIWDYINPSLVQQPRLPIKPEYPNPQRINSKA
jgi:hypothetical protein